MDQIRQVIGKADDELVVMAKEMGVSIEMIKEVREAGRLPVVNFAAGGIASPADASLMMQLGSDGIFVGSGIFKSEKPQLVAEAIVQATLHYNDPKILAKVSKGLGEAMPGLEMSSLTTADRMQERGI
jgi:pyridoxal 5'-phosphate synthase pdxS subunit